MKYAYIKKMHTILKWYDSDFSEKSLTLISGGKFLGKMRPFYLENSSNRQLLENSGVSHRPFYWKTHPDQMSHIIYGFSQKIRMDEFSSKTVCVTPQLKKTQNRYSWSLMDEFSSKTACVTTQKMKSLEKFLDEFSMICQ